MGAVDAATGRAAVGGTDGGVGASPAAPAGPASAPARSGCATGMGTWGTWGIGPIMGGTTYGGIWALRGGATPVGASIGWLEGGAGGGSAELARTHSPLARASENWESRLRFSRRSSALRAARSLTSSWTRRSLSSRTHGGSGSSEGSRRPSRGSADEEPQQT